MRDQIAVLASAFDTAEPLFAAMVTPLLAHLVEKSLVIVELEHDETRYWLLETIRQYGRDKLRQAGETERVRAPRTVLPHRQHADRRRHTRTAQWPGDRAGCCQEEGRQAEGQVKIGGAHVR